MMLMDHAIDIFYLKQRFFKTIIFNNFPRFLESAFSIENIVLLVPQHNCLKCEKKLINSSFCITQIFKKYVETLHT